MATSHRTAQQYHLAPSSGQQLECCCGWMLPGFLGEKLLQAAEAIVNDGIYPDWEKEAD